MIIHTRQANNLHEPDLVGYKAMIGQVVETSDVTITESGGAVSLNLERVGGGNLDLIYSDKITIFDTTPIVSVALIVGTDTLPTLNFVYILKSTGLLTTSTVAFPVVEHIPVATVLVQSAAGVAADEVYKLHVWTDHLFENLNNGHISHINSWIRTQPATWNSGVSQTLTIIANSGVPDDVIFTTTAGIIKQLHTHIFPAFTGTPDMFVVNDPATAFKKIADLSEILIDSTGASMSGRNFSIIIWASVNAHESECKLYINLPSGSYKTEALAVRDQDKFSNFNIPQNFTGTGFLIAEVRLAHSPAQGGSWTEIEIIDLRGLFPSIAAGGGVGGGQVMPQRKDIIVTDIVTDKIITLSFTPIVNSEDIFHNGEALTNIPDQYTISSNVITLASGITLNIDDNISVKYLT